MSFAMLLITGFDLMLVGRFEFAAVVPYSVSASMIAVISGLLGAVISVILPYAASLHAREQADEMGRLVISSTRLSVLLLIFTAMPIVIYAGPILRLWIGPQYVARGVPLLTTLLIANVIRSIGGPYATILVAAGQQNYIKISPLAEGVSNFVISVVLGSLFGGIGVALGTLLGSFVSLATHFFYSMVRTKGAISLSRRNLAVSGVLFPLFSTAPLLVTAAVSICGIEIRPLVFASATLLSLISAVPLALRTQGIYKSRFGSSDRRNQTC
jgi:O-antigen/teichoic acid export membrane protein